MLRRNRMTMWMLRSLVAVLILTMGLAATSALSPGELRVPQDYKTIQEAINAAKSGDTILVDPGTYVENLTITKREITIRGADPEKVIVQAKFADDPVVLIRERDVRISSLTLTGGSRGVQLDSRADTPALSRLVVRANKNEGLFVEGVRSGELRDSLIAQNGKGVFVGSRAAFRLQGNRITQNQDGVEASDANRLKLRENLVTQNARCGLKADERSDLVGTDNVIFGNGQDLCGAAQNRRDILDQTPPPAPRNLTVTPAEWTNQGRFTVDWENPSNIAGITAYYFKVGSAPTGPTDGTRKEISQKPLVIENPPEGEQPVFLWLEDGMGNKTHNNAAQGTIKFDKTPPTITAEIDPRPNSNGWNNTDVTVTFRCDDGLSGIVSCTPSDPVRFTQEGRGQTVKAEAIDQAGNRAERVVTINIDKTPPTGSLTINNGAASTNSIIVTLRISANDALSGVSEMRFSNDGRTWSDWESFQGTRSWDLSRFGGSAILGPKTVYAQLRDWAGNISQAFSATIRLAVPTLVGHTDFVTSVAFSPDGRLLASGSFDKTIKLWDISDLVGR